MNLIPTYTPPDNAFKTQAVMAGIREVPPTHIPVLEVYETVEGEGSHIGTPRVLARVSGCGIGCKWCDSTHTWMATGRKGAATLMTVSDFCDQIVEVAKNVREVSITGGEPMHYIPQMHEILETLGARGYLVSIETSGLIIDSSVFSKSYAVSLDVKTPSSGVEMTTANIHALIECAYMHNEVQLKAVVSSEADLEFIEDNFMTILNPACSTRLKPMILTPCADNTNKDVEAGELLALVDLCMRWNKRYHIRIIPQIHKWLYVDNLPRGG